MFIGILYSKQKHEMSSWISVHGSFSFVLKMENSISFDKFAQNWGIKIEGFQFKTLEN